MKKNNWNPKSSQRQPFFLARLKQKKSKKHTQKKPQKQIIFYIYNKKVFTVDSIVQQKTKYKNEKKAHRFPHFIRQKIQRVAQFVLFIFQTPISHRNWKIISSYYVSCHVYTTTFFMQYTLSHLKKEANLSQCDVCDRTFINSPDILNNY